MKILKNLSIILIVFVSIFCVACNKNNTNNNENNENSFIVTFMVDNTVYGTQTVEKGSKITKPENPTKAGYDFKGWFVNDEEWSFIGYVVTEDITLTAKWEIITYTATFKAGEEIVQTKDFTINDIEICDIPNVPNKTGYNGKWEDIEIKAENIVVNAVYTPIKYTAYFVANNNVIDTREFTIEDNEISEPEIPEKNGYNSKWEDYTIKPENITINVKYTPIEYKINYFLNNGTNNINNPTKYTIESDINLYGAKKQDYRFVGWYDNSNFIGDAIKKVGNGRTGDLDLYAKFGSKIDDDGNFIISSAEDYLDYASNVENYTIKAKLYSNIDLENYDVKPIGNINNPYMTEFDGNGFTIENARINVTTENFGEYLFAKEGAETSAYAHIGLFGNLYNATIKNITFKNLKINVSDDIYDYANEGLWTEYKTTLKELTVGGIAGVSESSTINANVSAIIDANSYGVYYEDNNNGKNFVGGIVGYANNTTISNLDDGSINIKITTDGKGKNSYIGGVAGGLINSIVKDIDFTISVNSVSKFAYYIGGVAGYVVTSEITSSKVDLNVKQVETERAFNDSIYVSNNDLLETYNGVGGVASVIRANDSYHITIISNVNITSNVDMDCIFGGAVYRVNSIDETEENTFVELTNLTVSSNVNVLKAYGLGFMIPHTKFEYNNDYVLGKIKNQNGVEHEYNILLKGKVSLISGENEAGYKEFATSVISQNRQSNSSVVGNLKSIYFICSIDIYDKAGIIIGSLYGSVNFI